MPVVFRPPANPSGGILDFDDTSLIVEFEKPRFFRDPDIVQINLPLEEIEEASYQNWLVGGRITVRTLYLDTAQRIPWRKGLNIDFTIPRRERHRARALVDRIEAAIDAADAGTDNGGSSDAESRL